MATLTANTARLPEQCIHKLPTSCRLTATPNCCACADQRSHSASYSKYIDGVGFVLRGTRQERYCWTCKEFWNARIEAANPPIRPAQTRIPEVPDQTEFLKSWYDFHRGYRIEKREDGTEERVAVRGEPLHDVAPGHLPRSLSDLRANAVRTAPLRTTASVAVDSQGTQHEVLSTQDTRLDVSGPATNNQTPRQNSLDAAFPETLPTHVARPHNDMRMRHRGSETRENGRNRAVQAEYQARRIGALRRELQRMRNGIERIMAGLNELGEHLPESQDAIRRSTNLDQRLESIQNRLEGSFNHEMLVDLHGAPNQPSLEARFAELTAAQRLAPDPSQYNLTSIPPPGETLLATLNRQLDQASADLEEARRTQDEGSRIRQIRESEVQLAAARVRQLEREKQMLEQNTRIFGSREEVERLGSNYESPIANMFNRAYVWRARVQEEERRRQEPATGSVEAAVHGPETAIDGGGIVAVQRALASNIAQSAGSTTNSRPGEAGRADLDRLMSMRSRLYRALGERGMHNEQQAEAVQQIYNTTGTAYTPPITVTSRATAPNDPWQLGGLSGARERYRREVSMEYTVAVTPAVETGDNNGESGSEERTGGLDEDDGRPAPKSDDEMTLKMECKVCYSQIADVAVIPCGHLVLCEWCANQYIPSSKHDHTRPDKFAKCPLCRKRVRQKIKVFRG